jgi:hypothetical protein
MSTLRDPPVSRLVTHLATRYDLTTLVETGTFTGESTSWAAEHFSRVVTIDIRGDDRPAARARCQGHRNIEFLVGDTRTWLPDVVDALDRPALFWLDAHAAPGLFGDRDDWPVLDELDFIVKSPFPHFILIDDAHCFLPGTPYPACPTIGEVEAKAWEGGYICHVVGDVIVGVPIVHVGELDDYFEASA